MSSSSPLGLAAAIVPVYRGMLGGCMDGWMPVRTSGRDKNRRANGLPWGVR